MLIKINSDDFLDEQIVGLKEMFNVNTASKAVMHAASNFTFTRMALDDANRKVEELELKLATIREALQEKQSADDKIQEALQ